MNLSRAEADSETLNTLLDDPKAVVRLRILRAARHLISRHGLSVSMEDIAEAARMGRRTMFRYFSSHEELIAAALSSALDWYDQQIAEVTRADQPLETWLTQLVTRLHNIHRAAGRGLWQLAAADDADLPPRLAAVNKRRRNERRLTTQAIAASAWKRAGGRGSCPPIVTDACALTVSSFATHSMLDDYGRDPASVARCTAALLAALLRTEVADRASAGRSSAPTRTGQQGTPRTTSAGRS